MTGMDCDKQKDWKSHGKQKIQHTGSCTQWTTKHHTMFNNSSISAVTIYQLSLQCIKLWRVHTTFQKYDVWSIAKALMSKCFWSYNYRLITTLQQHENLQLIVASQVDQLCQHVVAHSSPICLHQQTTVAKYPFHRSRGDRQTEDFSNGCSSLNVSLSQVPWPRPRPRLEGSKTKTETKTCKNGSRDQDSSLENSKSGREHCVSGLSGRPLTPTSRDAVSVQLASSGAVMVSPHFYLKKLTTVLVVVLKWPFISHRHHSHPLHLPSDPFSETLVKFIFLLSSGWRPLNCVTQGGPPLLALP